MMLRIDTIVIHLIGLYLLVSVHYEMGILLLYLVYMPPSEILATWKK